MLHRNTARVPRAFSTLWHTIYPDTRSIVYPHRVEGRKHDLVHCMSIIVPCCIQRHVHCYTRHIHSLCQSREDRRIGSVHLMTLSSDPLCAFISLHWIQDAWAFRLPTFSNSDELRSSPWHQYIHGLYGPLVRNDFPIDMRCFTILWDRDLPEEVRREITSHHANSHDDMKHFITNGHIFRFPPNLPAWWMPAFGPVHALSIVDGVSIGLPMLKPTSSYDRIEVFHHVSDCYHQGREVGYWMYAAPGSGIFFDVGKTFAHNGTYNQACHLLGGTRDSCEPYGPHVHRTIVRLARTKGYDSVQMRGTTNGGGGMTKYEIINVNSACDASGVLSSGVHDYGGCPVPGQLTRGRSRRMKCDCNASLTFATCWYPPTVGAT